MPPCADLGEDHKHHELLQALAAVAIRSVATKAARISPGGTLIRGWRPHLLGETEADQKRA